MTPVIEVSHLPSSASFYAAVCQPLGIHFVPQPSHSSSLDFGLPASLAGPCEILFTLTATSQPQISLLKFHASSQAAVTDFHWRALQANYNSLVSTNLIKNTPDESIARITDLDGNMLEARFIRRSSVPITASPKEARRVLDWQRDVAKSISSEETASASPSARQSIPLVRSSSSRGYETPSASPSARQSIPLIRSSSSRGYDVEQEPRLVRRETIATSHPTTKEVDVSADNRIVSGLSNQALIGTILGAAAGAALAYTMVKSEEPRPSEATRPRMVTYHSSPAPVAPRVQEVETIIEAMSIRSESHAGSNRSKAVDPPVVKQDGVNGKAVLEEIDEEKSVTHVSRRSHGSNRSQEKEPSQVKDSESRKGTSEVSKSSRHTSKSKKAKDQPEVPDPPESASGRTQKSYVDDDSKSKASKSESRHTSSYVSARSEASTVKPKDKEKEKARSKVTTTLTVSNKEALDRASQKGSVISARNVPLPESTHVPRSSHREHRDRDRDSGISGISARDVPLPESTYTIMSARNYPLPESVYNGPAHSVAPSDSISSVGLKRERQRRRM